MLLKIPCPGCEGHFGLSADTLRYILWPCAYPSHSFSVQDILGYFLPGSSQTFHRYVSLMEPSTSGLRAIMDGRSRIFFRSQLLLVACHSLASRVLMYCGISWSEEGYRLSSPFSAIRCSHRACSARWNDRQFHTVLLKL